MAERGPSEAEKRSWRTDPEAAYAEAERRIAAARARGATELHLGVGGDSDKALRALARLPPRISTLETLRILDLDETQVSDLDPIANLTALERILFNSTQVSDLMPIRHINRLSEAAEKRAGLCGLYFRNTPLARRPVFDKLAVLKDDADRTIQTLQYLNGTHPEFGGPPEPEVPDIPDAPGHALPAVYTGAALRAAIPAPPGGDALEHLFDMLKRYAGRLREPGALGNVPNALVLSFSDYSAVLPEDYAALHQVKLGLEGRALLRLYEGYQGDIRAETPEKAGQIEAMLTAHEDLTARLPEWLAHLAETAEVPEPTAEDAARTGEIVAEIADALEAAEAEVDRAVPDTLRFYAAKARENVAHGAITAATAVRDVIYAVIRYARDVMAAGAAEAKPGLSKGISRIITASVLGSLTLLIAQVPWLGAALKAGMEFLKGLV